MGTYNFKSDIDKIYFEYGFSIIPLTDGLNKAITETNSQKVSLLMNPSMEGGDENGSII